MVPYINSAALHNTNDERRKLKAVQIMKIIMGVFGSTKSRHPHTARGGVCVLSQQITLPLDNIYFSSFDVI